MVDTNSARRIWTQAIYQAHIWRIPIGARVCHFDKLTVYDGLSENNTMLGTFCGDNIPPPLFSSGAQMVVKLTSDYSMTYKGFNATIEFTNTLGGHNKPVIFLWCVHDFRSNVNIHSSKSSKYSLLFRYKPPLIAHKVPLASMLPFSKPLGQVKK